jgi:hypothetical protein
MTHASGAHRSPINWMISAPGLLPLTVPKVRRLLWHLVWERPPRLKPWGTGPCGGG